MITPRLERTTHINKMDSFLLHFYFVGIYISKANIMILSQREFFKAVFFLLKQAPKR